MRRPAQPLLAVPLLVGPGVLACFVGGYDDQPRLVAAIVAWVALAVVALTAPTPLPGRAPARLALAGLGALAAWTGLSLLWARLGGPAADDLQRLLLYVAYLAVALHVLDDPRVRPWAEPALAAAILGAILYGLSERLAPTLISFTPVISAGDRLAYPLTYWNGTGAFAALGLVLCAGLAGAPERPPWLRSAAAAAAAPLGLAVYLTFSRGALGALAAGLMLLLALRPTVAQLRGAALCVAAGLLSAAASEALPSVQRERGGSAAQGAAMAVVLVVLAAAGAALERRGRPTARAVARLRAAALTVLALAVVGSVVAATRVERRSGPDTPAASAARLPSVQSNRYAYWRVALQTFAAHPLDGIGSGSFRVAWLQRRTFAEAVFDAHSLELETAAELGIVGLAGLAAFLGGLAWGAARAGPALAPAVAALAVWALHSAIDWDWELPGFSLIALALGALLLSAPTRGRDAARDARDPSARGSRPAAAPRPATPLPGPLGRRTR